MISGYLISGIIFGRVQAGTFSIREFYARRIARIFPALTVLLAAVLLIGWAVMLGTEFRLLGRHVVASAAFVANEIFRQEIGYFDTAAELKPLLHLWSLGVEEQFYLIWPLLLWLSARRGWTLPAIVVMAVLSFGLNLAVVASNPTDAFFLTPVRLWELALGALIAWRALRGELRIRLSDNLLSWAGLAMIAVACVALGGFDPYPGWRALLPTLGTALVIVAGERGGAWPNRVLLSHRAIVYVGLISYPLYLWHWTLLSFARLSRVGDDPPAAMIAGAIVLAVILSALTYELVERPIRFGNTRRWRTPVLVGGMLLVSAAGFMAARGRMTTLPERGRPPLLLDQERYIESYRGGVCLVEQEMRPTLPAECESAGFDDTSGTSILLWGDSHAAQLYPALAALAGERGFALAQHTMSNCVPVLDAPPDECGAFTRQVLARVAVARPDVVILASRWAGDVDKVARTLAALEQRGVGRIVVVGPVPKWSAVLPRLILLYRRSHGFGPPPERMRFGEDPAPAEIEPRLRAAVATPRAAYVSALELLCTADGCLATLDGTPTAWDNAHLTEPAARLLARRILDASRATP